MPEITITRPFIPRVRSAVHRRSDDTRYKDRKARNLCVGCGLVPPELNRVRCKPCLKHKATISRSQPSYKWNYAPGTSVNCRGDRRGLNRKSVEVLAVHADRTDRCAICGDPPTPGRKLAIDHCHASGVVRGFLCSRCNLGLGYFRDDPAALAEAIEYLKRWAVAA